MKSVVGVTKVLKPVDFSERAPPIRVVTDASLVGTAEDEFVKDKIWNLRAPPFIIRKYSLLLGHTIQRMNKS